MSSTLLDLARGIHEDLEALERAAVAQLDEKPRTTKQRVEQQHRLSNLLEAMAARNGELSSFYEDDEGAFKADVEQMKGKDALKTFYEKVKETWAYHTKHPDLPIASGSNIEEEMEPAVAFSGEEVFGKYFDLHNLYMKWLNLPQCKDKSLDYGKYLSNLNKFEAIPEVEKRIKGYRGYVEELRAYLVGFLRRTQPLVDIEEILQGSREEFEISWKEGRVAGWSANASENGDNSDNGSACRPLDLKEFRGLEDLEALGMDRLKEALTALGLKCGGTLQQRAERLLSVKGVPPEKIDPKLKAKSVSADKRKRGQSGSPGWREEIAYTEATILSLLDVMGDVWDASKRQVEKKQTRTAEERDAEIEEEEVGVLPEVPEGDAEDSEDEGPIYNPLNLPLGWDGKPIPYWLYKLHGLGIEFKCEICGDFSYWGRRAFDRHFQEWRHAHGMRCLGIPNTKHFHDITLIQDAIDLYSKIKGKIEMEVWNKEAGEEYEDRDGNVLNRRTYEDMARQGLL
jgi:splicing factor 3A subunit 3